MHHRVIHHQPCRPVCLGCCRSCRCCRLQGVASHVHTLEEGRVPAEQAISWGRRDRVEGRPVEPHAATHNISRPAGIKSNIGSQCSLNRQSSWQCPSPSASSSTAKSPVQLTQQQLQPLPAPAPARALPALAPDGQTGSAGVLAGRQGRWGQATGTVWRGGTRPAAAPPPAAARTARWQMPRPSRLTVPASAHSPAWR